MSTPIAERVCARCGYSRDGIGDATLCPECGETHEVARPRPLPGWCWPLCRVLVATIVLGEVLRVPLHQTTDYGLRFGLFETSRRAEQLVGLASGVAFVGGVAMVARRETRAVVAGAALITAATIGGAIALGHLHILAPRVVHYHF